MKKALCLLLLSSLLAAFSPCFSEVRLTDEEAEKLESTLIQSRETLTKALEELSVLSADLTQARTDLSKAKGSLTQVRKLLSKSMKDLLTAKAELLLSGTSYAKAYEELTKLSTLCDQLEAKIAESEARVVWAAILSALAGLALGFAIGRLAPR